MGLFFEHSNYAFVENEEEEEEKEDKKKILISWNLRSPCGFGPALWPFSLNFVLTLSSTLVSLITLLITLLLHTTTVLPTNLWLPTFLVSIGEGLTDKVARFMRYLSAVRLMRAPGGIFRHRRTNKWTKLLKAVECRAKAVLGSKIISQNLRSSKFSTSLFVSMNCKCKKNLCIGWGLRMAQIAPQQ